LNLRQLLPEPDTIPIHELLAAMDLGAESGSQRPYTIANFISTVDGRASFAGRSAPLGDRADRELFHGLREQVDAIFAGTGTLRVERYGRLTPDPERRRRRRAAGRSPEPLALMVTRSGDLPVGIPLFAEPEARVVIFTSAEPDLGECAAQVELVRLDPGELTLTTVLRRLCSDYGVRSLLCEGGPTVFGALLAERLVDELFLTLAPKLAGGGTAPTIAGGPAAPELRELEPVWALEHGGALYLRYRLR
jgi:riboflavin-specific deaminase-like protein